MSINTRFIAPFNGPTSSITLRHEIFGDSRTVNYQTVPKRTRSGQLYVYKRTPSYVNLKLTFQNLRSNAAQGMSSREDIQSFFSTFAAQSIRFIDHNGQHWQCVVLSPTIDFVNQGKDAHGDLFGFTIELDAIMLVGQTSG